MPLLDIPKRLLVGRPLRSDAMGHTLLPKKLALPVFASDALSSVAYATEEILLVLSLGGLAFYDYVPWIAACVVMVLAIVTTSYRQTVREYPMGGGAYVVARENLGENPSLLAASALLIDYVLTVSVSIAAGAFAISSAVPRLDEHRVGMALGFIAFVTLMNLRGTKESGTFFAIPTYAFVAGVYVLLGYALVRALGGDTILSSTSTLEIHADHKVGGILTVLLLMRAFASGCTALTGVEAISDGVPAFQKPQAENAAKTLLMMAFLSITMFVGITTLAIVSKVHVDEHHHAKSVMSLVAEAVFGSGSIGFYFLQGATAAILILAANTAYQDFPRLASILAQDRFLPRQMYNRGDRLVFSNGVVILALFASALIVVFDAEVTKLIQLYVVGVFVSFTLSQLGMVRHWTRKIPTADAAAAGKMKRARIINSVGAAATFVVLIVALVSKFLKGAYLVCIAIPIIFVLMKAIHRHYTRVKAELQLESARPVLPSRNYAIVPVSSLNNPTLRALNYAKAIRPHRLEAVTVAVDDEDAARLQREWDEAGIDVPLVVIHSPYREVTRPLLDYIRKFPREGDRDVVTVLIPEFVVGHWWEHLLHNQSALLLKGRLLFQPGVMVTSVPWHLSSAEPEAEAETKGKT